MEDDHDPTRRAFIGAALGLAGLGGAAEIISRIAGRASTREAARAGVRAIVHPSPRYEAEMDPPKVVIEAISDRPEQAAD